MSESNYPVLTIEGLSNLGQGFAITEDGKIFVSKTAPQDQIKSLITKKTSKYTQAKLIEIIKASEFRRTAPCQYFSNCGGCSLQHLKTDFYQKFKKENLAKTFSYNNLDVIDIDWIWVGEHSRRRANFHIDSNNNLGFFEEGSNNLVKISNCLMLETELSNLISPLQNLLSTLPKNIFDQISATKFDNGISLIFTSQNSNLSQKITSILADFAKTQKLISLINSNSAGNFDIIYQIAKPKLLVNQIELELPNNIFLQATQKGQEYISNFIREIAAETKAKQAIDLYSGVGIYSFNLKNLEQILCFEGIKNMIDSININAASHLLSHKIKGFVRDLVKNPLQQKELKNIDLAIINPPRNGAAAQAEILAKSDIKNIIMVSCNPESFASDAKILVENDYKITKLAAIDQFYYSHHLELISHFSK